jgi:hypothetical protein
VSIARWSADPLDRDAFLLIPEVIGLLRELRPEEGLGEAMDQLIALVHHAYLAWDGGSVTVAVSAEQLEELIAEDHEAAPRSGAAASASVTAAASMTAVPRAYYAQLPERRIWAQVVAGETAEPLDGCFVHLAPNGELRVLGVFGLRLDRMGMSVVEAIGERPEALIRADGAPPYSPALPGGAAAGLRSVTGAEELLELGWRTRALAGVLAETR